MAQSFCAVELGEAAELGFAVAAGARCGAVKGPGWFLFIGRRTILGVRARARNRGEIPRRRLRCVGETTA